MIGAIPSWTLVALLSFPILSEAQASRVTVLFNSSTLSVTEGSVVGIQLIALGTCDLGFTVYLTFHDGSARLFRDYLYPGFPNVTPSVTFAPGSLSSSVFNVISIGNNAFDPRQRCFTVQFELPDVANCTLRKGRPNRLTVCTTDDDFVGISFERPTQKVNERLGCIPVRLKCRGLYSSPFQVSFTCVEVAPVEAENGADFISKVHTVTFDAVGTLKSTSSEDCITIMDDRISESKESFICVILRPHGLDGIVVEDPNTLSFTICDDDRLKVRFENDSYCGVEGTPVANIRLLATEFAEPFKVQIFVFTLDADATEKEVEADINVDYRDPQTLVGRGVVSFDQALGLRSSSLSIPLFSDNITEGTEYFGLTFVVVTDETEDNPIEIIPVEPTQVLVAIKDTNDSLVRFAAPRIDAYEGTKISVQVYRVGRIQQQLTIRVQAEQDTARRGLDFRLKTNSLVFNKLESNVEVKNVIVNIKEDNLFEGSENFSIVLDSGGGSPCSQQKLPVTILEV